MIGDKALYTLLSRQFGALSRSFVDTPFCIHKLSELGRFHARGATITYRSITQEHHVSDKKLENDDDESVGLFVCSGF